MFQTFISVKYTSGPTQFDHSRKLTPSVVIEYHKGTAEKKQLVREVLEEDHDLIL